MKKEEIMKNVSTTFSKVSVKLKKHSPEILIVAGVVGTVASAVMACHATTKLDSVLEKSKKDIDAIHKCAENEELATEYSKDDAKKDLAIVYVQAGVKVAKLYAPAVALGTLSIASIVPMEGYTYYFTYEETLPHRHRDYWQMPCSLGADLSQGDDFCAFTFLFPLSNGSFGVKTRNYISSSTLMKLPAAMRIKYDQFMKEGNRIDKKVASKRHGD